MIRFHRRGLALLGTAVLTAATVGGPVTSANAQPRALAAQGTTFQNSSFLTYGTGSQVHLAALQTTASKLVGVEQAFSAVSANSGGLGTAITDPSTGALVQPSLPGANAYGRGAGLEVGLGVPTATANQIKLGIAEASAPPIGPVVTKTVLPINLPGILVAGVLKGIAAAAYSPSFCPVGQPLAYGEGDAAGVGLLGSNPPLLTLSGNQTQTAQSQSRSDLVANSDGTFGLSSSVAEHIAPVSINLGAGLSIQVSVGGSGVNNPITLTAHSDGHGNNTAGITNEGTLVVSLVSGAVTTTIVNVALSQIVGPNGLVIDANTLPVVGALLTTLGITLNLAVGAHHAISGFPTGPNAISEEYNVLALNVALGATQIAGLNIGHMETGVDLASGAISCTVPVAKVANPAVVTAGNTFTWTILIPATSDSLADSTCDLTNIAATDKISVNSGSPTFTIGTISNGGTYNSSTGTITWTGLGTYHPGDPPIALTINVSVPSSSSAGVLQDTANVTAGLGNCTGGATGVATAIGNISNVVIGGSVTLIAPQIGAAGAGSGLATTGTGPMLPWLAAGLLLVAEATRRLLRRARRATP